MKQLLATFLVFLFLYDSGSSQPNSLQLTEILVIGEDQSDEMGYVLGQPNKIQVDSDGNIYVSDRSDHTIRVFDQNGEYQHSIGGRGRGPGEFLELTDFRLKYDGNLVALDRMQSKVVIFDPAGTIVNEHPLPGYIDGSAIYVFPATTDDQYFLGYINLMQQEPNGHFLHLFDANFENKISEHYDLFETYFDPQKPVETILSKSYSKISTLFHDNQIGIVPNTYTGTIHTFNTNNLTMSMMGESVGKFYEELDWSMSESLFENNSNGLMLMSGTIGRFFIRMKATNFGLVGNKNHLLQFYGVIDDDNITPRIHIYSSSGALLLDQNLSDILYQFISEDNILLFRPEYLDNNNKLYVIDSQYQDLYPTIRVFETNLEEFVER